MYKTSVLMKGLLVVSVAAILCGYVFAAEPSTQRDQDRTTQQTQQQAQQQRQQAMQQAAGRQMSGMLHRTSKLIGKEVKNTQNEDLGKLYDLVLTPDHQQVSYAVLSYGGTLGVGAKYFAIPWSAFQVNAQGDIILSASKEQLDRAPGFERDNWPAQPTWQMRPGQASGQQPQMRTQRESTGQSTERATTETPQARSGQSTETMPSQREGTAETYRGRSMTGRAGMGAEAMATVRDIQARRVSHLVGTNVLDADGEDIGNIEDFVIDTRQGQLAYTIVSFGGFWGIGEKYAAVPASAIQLQPWRHAARLDADRETLESIAFDPDNFPDLTNSQYAQRLHQTFNAEPYWVIMGFVSPEQEQAATQRAWGTEGEFARQFDAKNVKTVQGTVQSIGMFQPEGAAPGVPGGLRIRLMTDDGKLITVYAGPQMYAMQHDFHVMPGEKISVTGSETKIGWRDVFVASQIKAGEKTLQLRNETGQPMWQSQQRGMPEQREGTTQQQRSGQSTQRPGSTGQRQSEERTNQ